MWHWRSIAMGWSGPALWASGVSELRHTGATSVYDLDTVVGLAVETSEHARLCGVSLGRSSRR